MHLLFTQSYKEYFCRLDCNIRRGAYYSSQCGVKDVFSLH